MRITKYVLPILLPLAISVFAQNISITVTNNNIALVKEERMISLNKGRSSVNVTDVPELIDPTSVHIKSAKNSFEVLEQNFEYDLLDANKILNKSLEKEIIITHPNGGTVKGKLLFSDGNTVVLETPENELRIIPRNPEQQIIIGDFDRKSTGLITRPTLLWLLESNKSGNAVSEISYLTNGLTWHAEYVAVLNERDTKMELSSWVSLENRCGKTFADAKLKLIAGDINLVQDMRPAPRGYMMDAVETFAAKAQFEQKDFFEYHLYTLERKTTLKNNQTKQIQLFPTTETKVNKIFNYDSRKDAQKVAVIVETKNSKSDGLGIPLPKGKIRIYKKDGSELEFIGEDRIDHTAENEKVKIEIGKAFDIEAERKILERKRLGNNSERLVIEVELRNHKKENIEVRVTEPVMTYRNFEIIKSNFNPVEKDASKIEFIIPVKAGGTSTLNYEILYTW